MTTLHATATRVGRVLEGRGRRDPGRCSRQLQSDETIPLTGQDRERIAAVEQQMAGEGLRVLAVARKVGADRDRGDRT